MTSRALSGIHAVVHHPIVDLVAGSVIMVAAAWIFLELWGLDVSRLADAESGVLILVVLIVLRAAATLVQGAAIIGAGLECKRPTSAWVRFIHHPATEFIAALLVILAGIIEAVELVHHHEKAAVLPWCLGFILLGVSMLAKSAIGLIEGVHFLERGFYRQINARFWPSKIAALLLNPWVQFFVGVAVIVFGVLELMTFGGHGSRDHVPAHADGDADTHTQETAVLGAQALIVFGAVQAMRFFPHLFASFELIAAAGESDAHH